MQQTSNMTSLRSGHKQAKLSVRKKIKSDSALEMKDLGVFHPLYYAHFRELHAGLYKWI